METLLTLVAGAAVKATAILAIAGLITTLWRSASASARHLVWTVAVASALVLPIAGIALARAGGPQIPVSVWEPVVTVSADIVPVDIVPMENAWLTAPVDEVPSSPASQIVATPAELSSMTTSSVDFALPGGWKRIAVLLWATGALLALIPLAAALARVRLLALRAVSTTDERWMRLIAATPAIQHLANRVTLLESDNTSMPMTWGIFKPTLLLPSHAERWPEWQCRNILLHELAHVERRDCLTQFIAQITCAVYWFNPLAWVAAHRMRVERELACDDCVLSAGSIPSDYAANLLDVARSLRAPSFTSQSAIAMARPSQLSSRLVAVLDARRNRRIMSRRIIAVASFVALAVVLPLASITPRDADAAAMPFAIVHAIQLPATTVCWAEGGDGKNSVSINNDDSNSRPSFTVRYTRGDCSLELRAEGNFTLRPDLSDLETLASNGWFRVEERDGRSTKRIEIRPAGSGSLEHVYYVNGDRAAYDDNARAWLAQTLLAVERRTAFAASSRVPRLYRAGGLRGVLSEISAMPSAYPRSRYYSALLEMDIALDANTLNDVVRHASRDLSSSDYYLSEVLGKLGTQRAVTESTLKIFAEAAGKMKSDYYKSVVLKKVLNGGRLNDDNVALLLRSASSIESDYYRSELLRSINKDDKWDSRTSAFVLTSVSSIKSDYYKSESLKSLVGAKHVDNWPAFFNAIAAIDSDHYKRETLNAALRQTPLTRDIVAGVLSVAQRIKSDYEIAEVLSSVARSYRIDDDLRPAFEKAVDAIDSEHYRGAALSALRRSMSR